MDEEKEKKKKSYRRMIERRASMRKNMLNKNKLNDLFSFMGLNLVPITECKHRDGSAVTQKLESYTLPSSTVRILRISVEPGVEATGEELFKALQDTILGMPTVSILPEVIEIHGRQYSVSYFPPHGDELLFGMHAQDTKWIGNQCIGTALIGSTISCSYPQD